MFNDLITSALNSICRKRFTETSRQSAYSLIYTSFPFLSFSSVLENSQGMEVKIRCKCKNLYIFIHLQLKLAEGMKKVSPSRLRLGNKTINAWFILVSINFHY